MDPTAFYGASRRQPHLFCCVEEALANERAREIILLPPDSGDQNIDSDVEEDCNLAEPAGEVEVVGVSSDEEENEWVTGDIRWRKAFTSAFEQNIPCEVAEPLHHTYPALVGKTPMELWRLIWDNELMCHIYEQTHLYAARDKNNHGFKMEMTDLEHCLGIILFSGYHTVPSERDYWSNNPDLEVPFVRQTMVRDTFLSFKRFLHVADNSNLEVGNKVAKVQPVYNFLNNNLAQLGVFHQRLSIDEAMVPYRGLHSAKMYIRGKPIRFGFKVWCICGTDGYPYKLAIYTGKGDGNSEIPLGTRVVNDMLSVVHNA